MKLVSTCYVDRGDLRSTYPGGFSWGGWLGRGHGKQGSMGRPAGRLKRREDRV